MIIIAFCNSFWLFFSRRPRFQLSSPVALGADKRRQSRACRSPQPSQGLSSPPPLLPPFFSPPPSPPAPPVSLPAVQPPRHAWGFTPGRSQPQDPPIIAAGAQRLGVRGAGSRCLPPVPLISAPKNAARMKSPPQTGSGEAAERPDLVGTESCHYPPASVKLIHGTKTASSWHPARGAGARRLWGGRSAKESSGEPFGDEAPAAACRGSRGSQRVVPGEMVHPHRPRRSGSATSLVGRDGGRAEKDLRSGKASGDAFVLCR